MSLTKPHDRVSYGHAETTRNRRTLERSRTTLAETATQTAMCVSLSPQRIFIHCSKVLCPGNNPRSDETHLSCSIDPILCRIVVLAFEKAPPRRWDK